MKIVAIIGSPKGKGSGYKVVEKIEERMKALGDVEFEYIFLKDVNLKPCTGCYSCMAYGEEKCPLKDDRAMIEQKLLAADGVILSTPLYVNNVSGLMKNFIDRFAYANHRLRFFRQKVLIVINSPFGGKNEALMALKNILIGSQFVHALGIATPPWPQTEGAIAKKEKSLNVTAKKFYRACLNSSLPKPALNNYINFYLWKRLSLEFRQSLPADYEFYKDKLYYFHTAINPLKAALAKAIAGIIINIYIWKGMGPGNVPWPVKK